MTFIHAQTGSACRSTLHSQLRLRPPWPVPDVGLLCARISTLAPVLALAMARSVLVLALSAGLAVYVLYSDGA